MGDTVATSEKKQHFRLLQNFKPDYAVAEITQYESERTGMRVAVCDRQSPKVHGYFTLATEIHDDSGAPHTLEHLIFMGSKSYKYKGVLDKLATRGYSFTNAWTATDHTAYTLDTAGWAGFAQILPVYLEHVIVPTLTDSACYTEVWHIDGTGQDAGVVYSEMQGVQNTQGELMELQARRLMYPEGDGFRYETGGMMEALRVLTADRIREFHKAMYQPKNLRLVLIGPVDHDELIDILDRFEDNILHDVPPIDATFKRPWIESPRTPPLEKSIVKTVEFPDDDESIGEILIGFFGPDTNNTLECSAVDVLLTYLAGSSVSLLENTLVEKQELCSAVYSYTETRPDLVIWFTLSGVATKSLAEVEKRFFQVLQDAVSKPLDLDYMNDCIKRFRKQVVFTTETSLTIFSEPLIEDHLYGSRDGKDLLQAIADIKEFDILETWNDQQWRDLLSKYVANNNHVSILGVPSQKLSKQLKADEKVRVEAQKKRLGREGLKDLAKKLEEAKADNDKPIPKEVLANFKVPPPESIHFIESTTARSGLAKEMGPLNNSIQKIVDQDETDSPLFIHFEHIDTNFVHISIVLDTSPIPLELKPLLPVFMTNFFATPIQRGGKRVEFEQVVKELEQDTVALQIESGSNLGNSELLRIKFVVEREKYETAIYWAKEMMFNSIFDADRLKPTLSKLLADIPDEKRSGNDMLNAVGNIVQYAPSSSSRAQNTLVKAVYLKRIAKLLSKDSKQVISKLEAVRKSLFTFSNMRVYIAADLTKLEKPVSTWDSLVSSLDISQPLLPLDSRKAVLSEAALHPGNLAHIVPMPTIDSSFGMLTARGIEGYNNPQLPSLMVAIAYLDTVEGPMWTAVRGTGLAYGTYFSRGIDSGLISFTIYRSPDAYKVYAIAKRTVSEYASGEKDFDEFSLEGAMSSIMVAFADEQPTMINAAAVGFINQVIKGIPKDWGSMILRKVKEVTREQLKAIMKDVLLPVFQPNTAILTVTCATIMEEVSIQKLTG
jgi:Zn-dependent M16 (insulinase) family peptidase